MAVVSRRVLLYKELSEHRLCRSGFRSEIAESARSVIRNTCPLAGSFIPLYSYYLIVGFTRGPNGLHEVVSSLVTIVRSNKRSQCEVEKTKAI